MRCHLRTRRGQCLARKLGLSLRKGFALVCLSSSIFCMHGVEICRALQAHRYYSPFPSNILQLFPVARSIQLLPNPSRLVCSLRRSLPRARGSRIALVSPNAYKRFGAGPLPLRAPAVAPKTRVSSSLAGRSCMGQAVGTKPWSMVDGRWSVRLV